MAEETAEVINGETVRVKRQATVEVTSGGLLLDVLHLQRQAEPVVTLELAGEVEQIVN